MGDRTIWYNLAPVKESVQTKAVTEYTGDFGSFVFQLSEGKNFDNDKADATVFAANAKISKGTDGLWRSSTPYYWPNDGSSLTFISYAPYYATLPSGWSCTAADGFTITGHTLVNTVGYNEASKDVLVSGMAKDMTGNVTPGLYYTRGVPTLFKHILCKVKVVAHQNNSFDDDDSNPNNDYVTINSVSFTNIFTKGNFSSSAGWTGQSTTASYAFNPSPDIRLPSDLTQTEVFAETLMMPQPTTKGGRANAPTLKIDYTICTDGVTENKEATLALYNSIADLAAWDPGKIITYNLSISVKDEYIEFGGSPGAWTDGTGGDIDMGI